MSNNLLPVLVLSADSASWNNTELEYRVEEFTPDGFLDAVVAELKENLQEIPQHRKILFWKKAEPGVAAFVAEWGDSLITGIIVDVYSTLAGVVQELSDILGDLEVEEDQEELAWPADSTIFEKVQEKAEQMDFIKPDTAFITSSGFYPGSVSTYYKIGMWIFVDASQVILILESEDKGKPN